MEDILASIRRILAEDEPAPGAAPADAAAPPAVKDDVLVLDASMLAPGAPAEAETITAPAPAVIEIPAAMTTAAPAPAPPPPRIDPAPIPRAARPGNSISFEDAVRAAFQPVIKQWLDTALPKMTERIVRTEVERIVGNAVR